MKSITTALAARPRARAAQPEGPQALLEKLGIDTATARRVAARHEEALFLSLQGRHAPLALIDEGHGSFTIGTVPRTPNHHRPLPRGFGELALALATQAPAASLALLRAARECAGHAQTLTTLEAAYALACRASPPVAQEPTAHTTQSLSERDSVSSDPTSSVDSLDTVSSSSEDGSEVDIESEALSDTETAGPDPLEDMALSRQAQGVREASMTGTVQLGQAIAGKNPAEVKKLLRLAPYLLNEPLSNGETALQMAVAQGSARMVALLLDCKGIDPNKAGADGWTPLCLAVHKNEDAIAAQLLKHALTRPDSALPNGSSPLYLAVANNRRDIAQQLLRAGADIHLAKRGGFTPLHAACHAGHVEMVRWLLKQPPLWRPNKATDEERDSKGQDRSAVLNQRTAMGKTPLVLASAGGKLGVVQLLLGQEGVDPDLADTDHKAALHHAAAKGHTDVLACLLKHPKTHVNPRDRWLPPLFHAVACGELKAAEMLLDQGADIHWRVEDGSSILDACVHAKDGIARWLLKRPELRRQDGKTLRLQTVLNRTGATGLTVLLVAASEGKTNLVRILLDHGADPHHEDALGFTALQFAIQNGHLDTAKLLLPRRKPGINEPMSTGNTLLCVAIETGNLAVAAWLVSQGADILKANNDGSTPLHSACATGALAVRWLLNSVHGQHGRYPPDALNARDTDGKSALHRAASENAAAIVGLLLEQQDIDPNTSDRSGWTPLLDAARHGADNAVLQLLAHPDIDIFQKGPTGKTLLQCVLLRAHPLPLLEAIRAQLAPSQFQALREWRDDFDCLPVSTAAERGASDAVLDLLRPAVTASPVAHTATTFQRGWILEGYGMDLESTLADLGTKAGIEMHAVVDGDRGEALSFQKLQQLNFRPGDFVIVWAHSAWNADLNQLEMFLNEAAPVPLVEIASLLFRKGVLKVLFLGCEVNMAFRGMCNRLIRDPMIGPPQKGSTALESLDYTIVGRKNSTIFDLNNRAATLWLEDCAARRPKTTALDGALYNRSVQPMRNIGWVAATAAYTTTRDSSANADRLDHLNPAEASVAKADLLHLFAIDGRLKKAKALLTRHGVDPDVRTANGFTPLILACSAGRTQMVQLLLEHGADVHLVDTEGESALWEACSEGFAEPVKVLLSAGADPHARNHGGISAWDVAQMKGHTAILKLLPPPPTPTQTQPPTI